MSCLSLPHTIFHFWPFAFIHSNVAIFITFCQVYCKGIDGFSICVFHRALPNALIGVAHHVSFMRPYGLFDVAAVTLANSLTVFPYIDSIAEKMDFIGINYYGQVLIFRIYEWFYVCSYVIYFMPNNIMTFLRRWSLVLDSN